MKCKYNDSGSGWALSVDPLANNLEMIAPSVVWRPKKKRHRADPLLRRDPPARQSGRKPPVPTQHGAHQLLLQTHRPSRSLFTPRLGESGAHDRREGCYGPDAPCHCEGGGLHACSSAYCLGCTERLRCIESDFQEMKLTDEQFEAVNKVAEGETCAVCFVNMKDTFGYDVWPEESEGASG
ncbi:hypothetical protein ACO22_01268 [Paracoccidioides brasiliensis]|uniref:Uncharacterized protein n=1 Tax=Paracoccidioides brasiliensis TaxID=121759 RepID=A0A1D2JM58_PARBR|nr:hypothetical protein ACO22_01268 [Paracoccidioides brasiliensis]